ncbi:hypothetical protein ES705_12791 [subsurface metagenome]
MVKIKNPLGDVKIGRQGEVVYQRKYGEQIRRLASPKRAMASEAQIAHRQLYRDALAWRKQLSLANRRYLEGYCVANGVIDSYHIPLPWSRFALKLYLQAIKFVLITKPVAGEAGEEALFENYQYVRSGKSSIYSQYQMGNTFTPQVSHQISKVGLMLWRVGLPGVATIFIRATDGDGLPTGEDLTSVQLNANNLSIAPQTEFSYYDLPLYGLSAGVKYALCARAPDGAGGNTLEMGRDGTNPTYERGNYVQSTDYGVTWGGWTTLDHYFEEYGIPPGEAGVKGLLHVRHPALLAVVHKRGELTVNGYDTLSSLDREYLTGQVGLDVEAGDTIEATTLPGIDYRFKVV